VVDGFEDQFNQLIDMQHQVKDLHPALGRLYPIAIVNGELFDIYDVIGDAQQYTYQKSATLPMPVPPGVRAAFPLEAYGGKMSCVVTPDVFDTQTGYVTILHEFVHCYQFETCEQDLKMSLDVARKAKEEGDFMWEIEYPFPYEALEFMRSYQQFLNALEARDVAGITEARQHLETYLGRHDYEYMVWQEWKEGFARWVENQVKRQLKFKENKKGLEQPFSRVVFYAGGEALINYLIDQSEKAQPDLRELFRKMMSVPVKET
jgi:hypothetical protein